MKKYFKIWKQYAAMSFGSFLSNRIDSIGYFLGKIVRFMFFIFVIVGIFQFTDNLAGYSMSQTILFFLTFNLVDVLSQVAFRGIYSFGYDVKRGFFDYTLGRPTGKLFLILTKTVDFLDLVFLFPIIASIIFVLRHITGNIGHNALLMYAFFVVLGMVIVTAIHILIASITVRSTENEAALWLYRDSISISRFPPDILPDSIRYFFTVGIPIVVIAAFPVEALLGILCWPWMIFAVVYSIGFLSISLVIWKISLRKYSSASS